MKKRIGLVFVFIILSAVIISAEYDIGEDYFIEEVYGPEDTLKGWVNMSFEEEPSNSIFEFSVDGKSTTISLLKLLEGEGDFYYECSNLKCISDYNPTSDVPITSFTLDEGESALFGFQLSGDNIEGISNFLITISSSNTDVSNFPQLIIDVLNDDEEIWQAHTASGQFRDKVPTRYIAADTNQEAAMTTTQYCQRITIPQAPNVKLGAVLTGTGTEKFIMSIESVDSENYHFGDCYRTEDGLGEWSCEPEDFIVNEEQDYFVCIKAQEENSNYKINFEQNNPRGFIGNLNNGVYTTDFEIFVEPGIYAAVGEVELNDSEIADITEIATYVYTTYGEDCSSKPCIIPIKVTSMLDEQTINFLSSNIDYEKSGGLAVDSKELFNLTETPAKISAEMQQLSIDSVGFVLPEDYDDYIVSLDFEGSKIFSEEITVEKVPIIRSVYPTKTAVLYPTTFTVNVDSDTKIKSYEWDFGNEDTETTTTNKVEYTYDTKGNYTLEVRVVDIGNRSSTNDFAITIGSASEITATLLEENKENLETVKSQIGDFSVFEQGVLEEILDIDTIKTNLDLIETASTNAVTEADHQAVLQDLLNINLPQRISVSIDTNSIMFYPQTTSVNIDVLTDIAGGSYESSREERYATAVLGWSVQNVDITLGYRKITASFENHDEPLLNTFEIDITKKAGCDDDPYVILKDMEGLTFAGEYSEQEKSGYFYFPLIEESKQIIFSTTEDVDFIDLPLFVSPEISQLSIVGFDLSPLDESGKLKKWILFSLIILLLIIVGVVFWVILHAWYKKKYENYLFKNKNNLYNLFTWIGNAKKRGLSEGKLKTQLGKAGWNSEQLRYAMRKYSGKKTGMPGPSFSEMRDKTRDKKVLALGKFPKKLQEKLEETKSQPQTSKKRFRNL